MKRHLLSTNDRPRRTRVGARTILTVAGLTLAIAAVPAGANAAVRAGSVPDPQGDASSLSGPAADLKSVAIRYDDAVGFLRITWSYYNDIRAGFDPMNPPSGGASPGGPPLLNAPSDSAFVNWSAIKGSDDSWSVTANLQIAGASGFLAGTGTISDDGRGVTVEYTNPMLAGHDWQRGYGLTWGGDSYSEFWFDGYSNPSPVYPPMYAPTVPPAGSHPPTMLPGGGAGVVANQGMTVNDGAQYTNDPDVTLSIIAPRGVGSLRVSNDGGFGSAKTFPVSNTIRWHLAESGPERLPKTVYLRFGNEAQNFTDDIILDQTKPTVSSAAVVDTSGTTASGATVARAAAVKTPTYRVRIRAEDATSGVAKVQFARNKKHPSAQRKFARTIRYTASSAPRYVRVKDRAGNFSRWRSVR